ncbi:MAG: PAS domain S-box protein [SAR202 cluster bacterium]|nr:PAS domain S-box protein [SAR202 cluster bacterium]
MAELFVGYATSTRQIAVEAAHRRDDRARYAEILEAMQHIAEIMSGRDSFVEKCSLVLDVLIDLVPADLLTLRRPGPDGNSMELVSYASRPGFGYVPPELVTDPNLISYQAYCEDTIKFLNNYAEVPEAFSGFVEIGDQSSAFLPLISRGNPLGLIYIISKERDHFTPERVQLLSTIKDGLGVLFENADLNDKISEELSQRRQTQSALAESEARFRALAESAADILWEMDLDGTYTYCSPNVRGVTGYGPEELTGRSHYEFMPADEAERVRDAFSILAGSGGDISLMEYIFIARDGRNLTMERNGAAVLKENKELTGYRGIDRDITGRIAAEENLRETSRLASIGVLAAGVAHEINNPLTSVMLYSEQVLLEEIPDNIRKNVETVNHQALRMSRIVKSLLDFARYSKPESRETNIALMLHRAIELKSYDLDLKKVTVNDERIPVNPEDSPLALLDENQIIQVVLNLLNNAEHASLVGDQPPQVSVGITVSDGQVTIGVEDNGPGIPDDVLPKIFDPFFTTKEIGQGTGLGLSVSQGIVRNHDGEIWARNLPEGGAGFYFKLPIIPRKSRAPVPPDGPVRP